MSRSHRPRCRRNQRLASARAAPCVRSLRSQPRPAPGMSLPRQRWQPFPSRAPLLCWWPPASAWLDGGCDAGWRPAIFDLGPRHRDLDLRAAATDAGRGNGDQRRRRPTGTSLTVGSGAVLIWMSFSLMTRKSGGMLRSAQIDLWRGCHNWGCVHILPGCNIEKSTLGHEVTVGPFADLREGTVLGDQVSIGNFVEIKSTILGSHTKAKHLSYLGNATIGET